MKQIKHMILLCLFCLTGMAAQAQEEGPASNEIWYTAESQVTPTNIYGTGGAGLTADKNEFDESAGCWKITFSGDVITIGEYAFYECTELSSITIPASVKTIDLGAFKETALTSIEIPASVETIRDQAFSYCTELSSIKIPASVTSIGSSAFFGCESLSSVTFAEDSQLSEIGEFAFCTCTELSSITIPASVKTISDEAFNNCSSLETVTFAEGSQLSVIKEKAFYETAITSIEIPASVTSIGSSAFFGCESLSSVTFAEDSQLSEIGEFAFCTCTELSSITIPASVKTISDEAFNNCSSLETVTFAEGSKLSVIKGYAFYETAITSIKIPASVTEIGLLAFNSCYSLETVTFAEDSQLSIIGDFAFCMCTGLSSITIPASVKTIGDGAFSQTALTSIEIPASVETISDDTFNQCSSLGTVTFAEDSQLSEIGRSAFQGCYSLETIDFAECPQLSEIGGSAFAETALTSIEIPASVMRIEYDAFSKCQGLASITVANGNEVYESPDNCNAIIEKESKALIIGCQNTIIPNTVESIGPSAFQDCPDLTSIEIPASVTEIGEWAFGWCTSLETVTFAEGSQLSEIGGSAFAETALTSIEIPASVTIIGDCAFGGAGSLASVTVHWTESLPSMDSDPFTGINENAVLNVPFGTVAKYSAVNAFKDFFKEIKSPDFELGVSSAGWASMYLPCAVTIPSDAEVYYASAVSGSTITLSEVKGILPAKTGVIVKAEEGTVKFAETAEAETPIDGNLFEGVLADKSDYKDVYVLSGASAEGKPLFQEYNGDKLNAFKAYLPMSAVPGGGEIKFRFDEATGIESLTPALSEGEGAIYNLNGVRVDGSYKGIVIRNGKKMFNK